MFPLLPLKTVLVLHLRIALPILHHCPDCKSSRYLPVYSYFYQAVKEQHPFVLTWIWLLSIHVLEQCFSLPSSNTRSWISQGHHIFSHFMFLQPFPLHLPLLLLPPLGAASLPSVPFRNCSRSLLLLPPAAVDLSSWTFWLRGVPLPRGLHDAGVAPSVIVSLFLYL